MLDSEGNKEFATYRFVNPYLADVNNDGLKDLFVADALKGGGKGLLSLYLNTGTKESPEFTLQGEVADRFGTVIDHNYLRINVVDMNNDGLLDIVTGENEADSYLRFYENVGTKEEPSWDSAVVLTHIDGSVIPFKNAIQFGVGDIDNDGIMDIILHARHHSKQASNWMYEAQLGYIRGYLHGVDVVEENSSIVKAVKLNLSVQNGSCRISDVESVQLFSLSGKLLQQKSLTTAGEIVLNGLSAGCYLLQAKTGNRVIQQKLLIQ